MFRLMITGSVVLSICSAIYMLYFAGSGVKNCIEFVHKFLGSKQSFFASLINNCIYTNIYIIYTQMYLHI